MPYTAQFFAEKLGVPVEYFNPFRSLQIDPGIDLEELAKSAHALGEVVGLGLRNLAHCPVELNLMPESTLRWQSFKISGSRAMFIEAWPNHLILKSAKRVRNSRAKARLLMMLSSTKNTQCLRVSHPPNGRRDRSSASTASQSRLR